MNIANTAIVLLSAVFSVSGSIQRNESFYDIFKIANQSNIAACSAMDVLLCSIFKFQQEKSPPSKYMPLDGIDADCNITVNGTHMQFFLYGRFGQKYVEQKFTFGIEQLKQSMIQPHLHEKNGYSKLIDTCSTLRNKLKKTPNHNKKSDHAEVIKKSEKNESTKPTGKKSSNANNHDMEQKGRMMKDSVSVSLKTASSKRTLANRYKDEAHGIDYQMINKETERNTKLEKSTFENEVSRYEIWKKLSSYDCHRNITKCTIIATLNNYSIVENTNDDKKTCEIHLVYDNEFACNGIKRNQEHNCLMQPSKYGIFRDLSSDNLAPNEIIHASCKRYIAIQRFFYSGQCQINVKKEKNIHIRLLNMELSGREQVLCYSIFINNKQIRTGTIQLGEQVSVPYALNRAGSKVKIYCGQSVYERVFLLDTLTRCAMLLEDSGLSDSISQHVCKFIHVYKIFIISALVICLLLLILKCGLSFIMLPVYIAAAASLSMLQLCLRRKTVCSKCASRLYWGDPHLTCRFACSYCETFASSDYNDLYNHKKNCENIHLKVSPVLIFRVMLRSKFIINCINLATALVIIWLISSITTVGAIKLSDLLNETKEAGRTDLESRWQEINMAVIIELAIIILLILSMVTMWSKFVKQRVKYTKLCTIIQDITAEANETQNNVYNEPNNNRLANYMIAFGIILLSIQLISAETLNSQNFPALREVKNLRTGDQFHFPNVKAIDLKSFVGGTHDTASGVLNTVSRLSKALDGQYDEYEDENDFRRKPSLDDETKQLLSLLNSFTTRLEDTVKKSSNQAEELKVAEQKINHGLSYLNEEIKSNNKSAVDQMNSLALQIENIDRRIENLYSEIVNNPKNTDARKLYEELGRLRQTIINKSSARQPKSRRNKRNIENNPTRKNEERELANDIEDNDLLNSHKAYVYSRHSASSKSSNYMHSLYASRVMANEEICQSQGLYVDTIEREDSGNKAKIKIIASMDIMAQSCMVFDLKSTEHSLKPTKVSVKILQTKIEWPIQYLYSTYKTNDIQIVSQEWCVSGAQYCRKQIMLKEKTFLEQGGIIISWDNCQNWGCDFPGCGTMNSGSCCIICRDTFIHETEIRVYKLLEPKFVFEICVQYPGKSKCFEVASTLGKPTRSFTFSATISELQSQFRQGNNVAIDHYGKIMYGDICNPSAYCDNFGSMQVVDGIVHGKDGHSADFVCHGIGWKTYEVRSCFKNTWQLHTLLSTADSKTTKLHETDAGSIITENGIYLGKAAWTLELEGVHLEEKVSKVDLTANLLDCKGCWNCLEHAICSVNIDSNIDTAASVTCEKAIAMSNHIGISFGSKKYYITITFLHDDFKPECKVITGDKIFRIKQMNPIWLPRGNITWQDTEISTLHKEVHPDNTLLWSWKSLNPFSLYGWTNWQILVKAVSILIIILLVLLTAMIATKYIKLSNNMIRTVIQDLKGLHNNESTIDLVLMEKQRRRAKYKDNVKERNLRAGVYKFD